MLIYRIESSKGIGPYVHGVMNCIGNISTYTSDRHPTPINDGIALHIRRNSKYYYGFSSMWHLRRWFNKDLRKQIVDNSYDNFFCYIYRVDPSHVEVGKKQVAFLKHKAEKIYRTPLSEI